MATVVSTLFISLDGVAEVDPTWHFPYFDEAMGAAVADDYDGMDALVLGRITYDSFASAWPGREEAGEEDAAFAAQLGDTRKVVATRGSTDLGWRNVEATDDVVAAVRALRDDPALGKVVVAGSVSIVAQLLNAGLLDELRLLIHPVVAGSGQQLFALLDGLQAFRLVTAEPLPSGVIRAIYAPAELPAPGGA